MENSKNKSLIFFLFFIHLCTLTSIIFEPSYGFDINPFNGGVDIVFSDLIVPTGKFPIEVLRSYKSITATHESNGYYGFFGWGWAVPFESTFEVLSHGDVAFRDTSSGNTLLFSAPQGSVLKKFIEEVKKAYLKKNNVAHNQSLPLGFVERIQNEPQFRSELIEKYHIRSFSEKDLALISKELGYQTLYFKDHRWIRNQGTFEQVFNEEGQLLEQNEPYGTSLLFQYDKKPPHHLILVKDKRTNNFITFIWKDNKVKYIADTHDKKAKYFYDYGGNLVKSEDAFGNVYEYKYEKSNFPHLLTELIYREIKDNHKEKKELLDYDDRGLVKYHKNLAGSEYFYSFGHDRNNKDKIWTNIDIVNSENKRSREYHEYEFKPGSLKKKYIYKEVVIKNDHKIIKYLSECCSLPEKIVDGDNATIYQYNDRGLLVSMTMGKKVYRIEYDPIFKSKISKVIEPDRITSYTYNQEGNLKKATNSLNKTMVFRYNEGGIEVASPGAEKIILKFSKNFVLEAIDMPSLGRILMTPDGKLKEVVLSDATSNFSRGANKERQPSSIKAKELILKATQRFVDFVELLKPSGINTTKEIDI